MEDQWMGASVASQHLDGGKAVVGGGCGWWWLWLVVAVVGGGCGWWWLWLVVAVLLFTFKVVVLLFQ